MTTYTLTGYGWDYETENLDSALINARQATLTIQASENYTFSYTYPFEIYDDPEADIQDVNGEIVDFSLNGMEMLDFEYVSILRIFWGGTSTTLIGFTDFDGGSGYGSDYSFYLEGTLPPFWDGTPLSDSELLQWAIQVTTYELVSSGPYAPNQTIALGSLPGMSVNENDSIVGTAGNDDLAGGLGNDTLKGLTGDDTLNGGQGADVLDGGAGIDTADYVDAATRVFVDLINTGNNTNEAAGDSYIGIENIRGSLRGDDLRGNNADNLINGSNGDDFIMGRGGNDILAGGNGNDTLIGGDGNDVLSGGDGNNVLNGGVGNDRLVGGADNDRLIDTSGDNSFVAGAGDDVIYDGRGASVLYGGSGSDRLIGSGGNDRLLGGTGFDTLNGGNGNDTLAGHEGNDYMVGGGGADLFAFQPDMGADRIQDFELGADQLIISSALTGGETDAATVLATYASHAGGTVLFDFGGGNTLELLNLGSTTGLEADMLIS